MASTSRSSDKNDVYISFTGFYYRHNFVSHLYEALSREGIKTFFYGNLSRRVEIPPSIFKTIEESQIAIVVLTKYYASSAWCLDELLYLLNCRNTTRLIAFPVFYAVDPSDVRKQTGSFGDEFTKLVSLQEYSSKVDNLHGWKAAMEETASLSGWDSRMYSSGTELVENIVGHISKIIRRTSGDNEQIIGTESLMEQMKLGNEEWLALLVSLILEALSALFEQLSRALMSMIVAAAGLLLCIGELIYRARKEQVYWENRGSTSWFYSHYPNYKLFGTTIEYFQLVVATWQCFHSTMSYLFACMHKKNPINMSVTMLLLCLCLLISKTIKRYSAVPPPRSHNL